MWPCSTNLETLTATDRFLIAEISNGLRHLLPKMEEAFSERWKEFLSNGLEVHVLIYWFDPKELII